MVVKVKKSEIMKEKDHLKRVSKIYKMNLELQETTYFFLKSKNFHVISRANVIYGNHIAMFFYNIKPLIAEYEKMLLGVGSVNFFLTFYVPLKGL